MKKRFYYNVACPTKKERDNLRQSVKILAARLGVNIWQAIKIAVETFKYKKEDK